MLLNPRVHLTTKPLHDAAQTQNDRVGSRRSAVTHCKLLWLFGVTHSACRESNCRVPQASQVRGRRAVSNWVLDQGQLPSSKAAQLGNRYRHDVGKSGKGCGRRKASRNATSGATCVRACRGRLHMSPAKIWARHSVGPKLRCCKQRQAVWERLRHC
jgi:hypothetical protein